MRVLGERRSPGVEDGGESDAGTEVLGVGGNGDQGLGGGFEQQVIDDRLVLIGNVGDRSRQGEDDMEIGHGQEFGLAVGQPLLGSRGLALWAMPIAAGNGQRPLPALWAKPVMGSWRRHHHGRAEIRRAYAPHYELAIAKRSAALSVENSLCRDATEQRSQRFGFFRWEYSKATGHGYYGERNGRDAS